MSDAFDAADLWAELDQSGALDGALSQQIQLARAGLIKMPRLVVVRESDAHDRILFDGMRLQTLALARAHGFAGVDDVERWGLDPMDHPGRIAGLEVRVLRHGKTRAYLFSHEGTWFLYCMSSAWRTNDAGDNDFTQILCNVVAEGQPDTVLAANFQRLVRNALLGNGLLEVCGKNVREVIAGENRIILQGEGSQFGHVLWQLLASMSQAERNGIVQRLTAGVVNRHRQGRWILGDKAVPPGYRWDEETSNLVLDPEQASLVRRVLELLASNTPGWMAVRELGGMGMTTPRLSRIGKTVDVVAGPDMLYRSMLRWAPLWATGIWHQRLANPFPGVAQLAGYQVHRAPSRKRAGAIDEYLLFDYNWGLPNGGWAPYDVLLAAVNRLRRQQANIGTRPRGRQPLAPFTNLSYVLGDDEWRLFTVSGVNDGKYELRGRQVPESLRRRLDDNSVTVISVDGDGGVLCEP